MPTRVQPSRAREPPNRLHDPAPQTLHIYGITDEPCAVAMVTTRLQDLQRNIAERNRRVRHGMMCDVPPLPFGDVAATA